VRQYAAGKELPELLLHELGQAGPVGAVGCLAKKGLQMGADDGSPLSSAQPLLLLSGTALVHGADGLDEISNTGENHIAEVREGIVRAFTLRPEDFGLPRVAIGDLQGGDREENAQIIRQILQGEAGPKRDIVLMNASAALMVGGKAKDFKDGAALASRSIDSGAALAKLLALIEFSRHLSAEK